MKGRIKITKVLLKTKIPKSNTSLRLKLKKTKMPT